MSSLIVKYYKGILTWLYFLIPIFFFLKIGLETHNTPNAIFGGLLALMFCTVAFGALWTLIDIHRLLQERNKQ